MNLLGGSGTVCAAFLPMYIMVLGTAGYEWLYQTLMITTILVGLAGIWTTIKLVKGGKDAFKWTLIILSIGTVLSATQYFGSLAIRGAAAPANVKFYTNVFTLLFFLIIRYTKLGAGLDFEKENSKTDNTMAGGLAAFISGMIVLSVFVWAGPSHTHMGESWVEIYTMPIIYAGILLLGSGVTLILRSIYLLSNERVEEKQAEIA
jgi:hypothetical protein